MRIAGLIGAALLLGMVTVVATAPSSDAETPDWMKPMVEAGRTSLLDNLDLIEPGSPLVLVSAQCREDGAVRLIYENRWLWVLHRQYHAEAAPGWVSGSMGGGVLHGPEDWLAGQAEVECTDVTVISLPHVCIGDAFSIGYPEGWWVHPADPALRIDACSFFAAAPARRGRSGTASPRALRANDGRHSLRDVELVGGEDGVRRSRRPCPASTHP